MQLLRFFALALALHPLPAHAVEFALLPSDFADAIQTGSWSWELIISLIFHWIELGVILAGSVAVILIMIGGYQYIFGAISEDKEQGKNTIIKVLIGYSVILLAWIIVDIFISLITQP